MLRWLINDSVIAALVVFGLGLAVGLLLGFRLFSDGIDCGDLWGRVRAERDGRMVEVSAALGAGQIETTEYPEYRRIIESEMLHTYSFFCP